MFSTIELAANTVTLKSIEKSYGEHLVALANMNNMSPLWFTQVPNAQTIANYIDTALQQKKTAVLCLLSLLKIHQANYRNNKAL